ncbi:MAG: Spy/CpxP family protein refolding chaperone [Xenococcaceae cyanobacterium MO_207.B15]|nr:Spy/CpxP family protein refolding chaperone [Xenococcaceae cyanobacterium MO_207.B15]
MQLQKISFIAVTIALSLAITPLAVKAETNSFSYQRVTQVSQIESLGLTETQKAQLAEIRQDTRAEIQNILTPQQQEQFQTITANRDINRQAFKTLNLSDEQKSQVRNILLSTRSEVEEILTPEQRQQIKRMRRNWLNNRF